MTTTRRTRSRGLRRIAPVLVTALVLAAACGDDASDDVTFEDPPAENGDADGDGDGEPADPPADDLPDEPGEFSPYVDVTSDDEFCLTYRDLTNEVVELQLTASEEHVPAEFEAYLELVRSGVEQLVDVAPDELEGAVAELRDSAERELALYGEFGFDPEAIPEDRRGEAEFPQAASEELSVWIDAECGIDQAAARPDQGAPPAPGTGDGADGTTGDTTEE